jgi:hypothetical protein
MMFIGIILAAFSLVNLAYFLVHANGKKYVRLYSAIVLMVLAFKVIIVPNIADSWLIASSAPAVMDTIIDWRRKQQKGEK